MLSKKENKNLKYLKIFLMLLLLVIAYIFRTKISDFFFLSYQNYFLNTEGKVLTPSEYEELGQLRIENKILADENKKIREEFSVGIIDEVKAPVYLLLSESYIYGDFFVSIPKDKTPYIGMNIFSSGNIVVGQVSEILTNSLKVKKLGDGKTFIAESLENEEPLELQSLGTGLYFGKASGGSKISLGDTIVLKGYPKAIVGTVVEIEKGDTALSNIFVRTPYNIDNKEIFYVIQ
jgi:hypothetical protein